MPVYEFRCPKCLQREEEVMPMANRNNTRLHSCGTVMERLVSLPRLAIFKVYGKDRVVDTLNEEDVREKKNTGAPLRSKRSQEALYRGIDYVRPLEEKVFTGF